MKNFPLILLSLSIFLFFSCKENKPNTLPKNDMSKTTVTKHYICSNKCENSGGDVAGNCPVCNTPYTHNQAFHNGEFLKNGPIKVQSNTPLPTSTTNNPTTTAIEPAQNANGVYHYTCKNACYGGAGTAINCNSCGELLVHNTAYHN
jgi:hypothetical protein